MSIFIAVVVSGAALGLLLGLLGFGIVVLYRATGIVNFGQGVIGAFGAFIIYNAAILLGINIYLAIIVGLAASVLLGVLLYYIFFRINDEEGSFNLTIRTLGVQLFILAILHRYFADGQPFSFPSVLPNTPALQLGDTVISWLTVGTLACSMVLIGVFVWIFNRTDVGLKFAALAERPDVSQLLGIQTRRLAMIAWIMTSLVATIVGTLLAPIALLSSEMMEPYMLLAFTAVVLGGLNSLYGVFVAGVIVGVVNNIVSLYFGQDTAVLTVFVILLGVLSVMPNGMFSTTSMERL